MFDFDERDNEIARLGHRIFWLERKLEETKRALVKERDRANDLQDRVTELECDARQDRVQLLRGSHGGARGGHPNIARVLPDLCRPGSGEDAVD